MNRPENLSTLFLCNFCLEGFGNALDLTTHKKQHEKLTGSSGPSMELPTGSSIPVNRPFQQANVEPLPLLAPGPHIEQNRSAPMNKNSREYALILPECTVTEYNEINRSDMHSNTELSKSGQEQSSKFKTVRDFIPEPAGTAKPDSCMAVGEGNLNSESFKNSNDSGSNQLSGVPLVPLPLPNQTPTPQLLDLDIQKQNNTSSNQLQKQQQQQQQKEKKSQVLSQKQQSSKAKSKSFRCDVCGKSDFLSKSQLLNHESMHSGAKPFPCTHCNKFFTRKSSVAKHLSANRCRIYNNYQKLEKGNATSPPALPQTSDNKTQQGDSDGHTSDLSYNCTFCGECYASASEIKEHFKKSPACAMLREKSLTPVKSNHTQLINDQSPSSSSSTVHYQAGSASANSASPQLPFQNSAAVTQSEGITDDQMDPEFDDQISDDDDADDQANDDQINNDADDPMDGDGDADDEIDLDSDADADAEDTNIEKNDTGTWKCRFCRKEYSSRSNAANHERIMHTGEKPFQCSHCDRSFSLKRFLANHEKSHRKYGFGKVTDSSKTESSSSKSKEGTGSRKGKKKINKNNDLKSDLEPNNSSEALSNLRLRSRKSDEGNKNKRLESSNSVKSSPVSVKIKREKESQDLELLNNVSVENGIDNLNENDGNQNETVEQNQNHQISGSGSVGVGSASSPELDYVSREIIHNKVFYCCKICYQKYSQEYHCVNHVRNHLNYKPFPCSFCDARFITNGVLKMHERCHLRGKQANHTCEYCDKSYPFKSQLLKHQKICADAIAALANIASKSMADQEESHEEDPEQEQLSVNIPSISKSKSKRKLKKEKIKSKVKVSKSKQHKEKIPPILSNNTTRSIISGRVNWNCNFCNKDFSTSWYAVQHVKIHTGEVSYKCTDCDKEFTIEYTLKLHRQKHHPEELPFKCKKCGVGFLTAKKLKSHRKKNLCVKSMKRMGAPSSTATNNTPLEPKVEVDIEAEGSTKEANMDEEVAGQGQSEATKSNEDEGSPSESESSPTDNEMEIGERIETYTPKPEETQKQKMQEEEQETVPIETYRHKKKAALDAASKSVPKPPLKPPSAPPLTHDKYRCEICDQSFQHGVSLYNHKKLHQGPYCQFCGDRIIQSLLDAHEKKCGLKVKPATFVSSNSNLVK